jgi:hypothetical protein
MKLTKKQKKELQSLADDINFEAKEVRLNYEKNPSELSGSVIEIHEHSPFLDTHLDSDKPLYNGNRWKKVIKGSVQDALEEISKKNKKKT